MQGDFAYGKLIISWKQDRVSVSRTGFSFSGKAHAKDAHTTCSTRLIIAQSRLLPAGEWADCLSNRIAGLVDPSSMFDVADHPLPPASRPHTRHPPPPP